MPKAPDISVIIVNFNGAAFICECLDALFGSKLTPSFEVVMVDNASTDNSLEVMAPYMDKMTFIQNDENTGFAFANNQAINVSTGRYVFLLNTDAIVDVDAIETMWQYHEAHPHTGAIAPKLLNADGSLQVPGSSLGAWRFKQDRLRQVPFIAGAAVLMRRSVMDEMGGMDENLFFYNDDIDMCRFLRSKRYPIIYLPQAEVLHYGGLSTNYRKVGSLIEGYRGGIYLAAKHYGVLASLLYRVFLLVDLLPRLLIFALRGIVNKQERDLFFGYVEVLRITLTNDVYLERVKQEQAKEG